jgi:hypothetical protein
MDSMVTLTRERLTERIQSADPDDLDLWREILYERQQLIDACTDPAEAEELFRLGEVMEIRLRIARAKLDAQCAECYHTGFLLRAMSADMAQPETGSALDVTA